MQRGPFPIRYRRTNEGLGRDIIIPQAVVALEVEGFNVEYPVQRFTSHAIAPDKDCTMSWGRSSPPPHPGECPALSYNTRIPARPTPGGFRALTALLLSSFGLSVLPFGGCPKGRSTPQGAGGHRPGSGCPILRRGPKTLDGALV